jgi:hypothetical protein
MPDHTPESRRRQKIIEKIKAGAIERHPPGRIIRKPTATDPTFIIGTGSGERCAACDEPISESEPKMRWPNSDVVVHADCETAWIEEGRRL